MTLPIAPDNSEERPGPLGCLITTPNPLVSLDIEQTLLDDIKQLINEASRRLTKFKGSGGTLKLDWLNQLKAYTQSTKTPTNSGDGLYCLLRNAPTSPCSDGDTSTWGGGGILDIIAKNLTVQFAQTAGPNLLPLNASASLIAAWQGSLSGFQGLTNCQRVEMINDYLDQRIGNPSLTYHNTIPAHDILDGLVEFAVNDISFEVDINNAKIVQDFSINKIATQMFPTPHNDIHLVVGIPSISGKAWVSTAPTATLVLVLATGAASCYFLSVGCTLFEEAVIVSLSLALNIAYLNIDLGNPTITVDVSLQPDAQQRLFPVAEVQFSSSPNVFLLDVAPSVLLSLMIDAVLAFLKPALNNIIGNELQKRIQGLLNDTAWRFPILESPLADQYVVSEASAQANSYLDAISQLDTILNPPVPGQQITSEDQLTHRFRDLVPQWPSTLLILPAPPISTESIHLWGGYGISQNYLNLLIAGEWQAAEFTYSLDLNNDLAPLVAALEAAYPGLHIANSSSLKATLAPDTAPRLLLTPQAAASGGQYAVACFDDLRLCITDVNSTPLRVAPLPVTTTVIDIRFGATMPAEIAFGVLDPNTNQLDFTKQRSDRQFEVYYDLTNISLDPTVQGVATFGPSVAAIQDPLPASMQPALNTLVGKMLSAKNAAAVPGIPGGPGNLQAYPLGEFMWFICQLLPGRGNLYMQLGFAATTGGAWDILSELAEDHYQCSDATSLVAQLLSDPANLP